MSEPRWRADALPERPGVAIGVLARSDEPALGATLYTLEAAARGLARRGHDVSFALCVNGDRGEAAVGDAQAFARRAPFRATVIREARADKARAWNLVRAAVVAPIVVFSDADVEVEPGALLCLVAALEAHPEVALASARQVPRLAGATLVGCAAALPYRFDFGVVGGRLYALRSTSLARMPEGLLLEDGWLSAELGRERLLTVPEARVLFLPPRTLADYFRERLRTEAGKLQIRAARARAGQPATRIARYPWAAMVHRLAPRDWPLVGLNLGVRLAARAVAEIAMLRGREVRWQTVATSKAVRVGGGT